MVNPDAVTPNLTLKYDTHVKAVCRSSVYDVLRSKGKVWICYDTNGCNPSITEGMNTVLRARIKTLHKKFLYNRERITK